MPPSRRGTSTPDDAANLRQANRRLRAARSVRSSVAVAVANAPVDPHILRRSARVAAIEARRREFEENALRQQREQIAHTHRNVTTTWQVPSSTRIGPPVTQPPPTPPRTLVRQNAIRQRFPSQVLSSSRQVTRPSLFILQRSRTGRMQASRPPRDFLEHFQFMRPNFTPSHDSTSPLHIPYSPEIGLNFGLLIGVGNRYSSDSEDSYYTPRVIDPDAISEDETDDDSTEVRELSPPPSTGSAGTGEAIIGHRPVTRSMSSRQDFYEDNAVPTVPPVRLSRKRPSKATVCKVNGKAGTSSTVKTVIKVEKVNACTICYSDEPKRPVACMYCRQVIGCRHCVKKWFYTTNMSHLDQRTPYPMGGTDRNHKRCPLCRADWGDSMQICTAVEDDVLKKKQQVSSVDLSTTIPGIEVGTSSKK